MRKHLRQIFETEGGFELALGRNGREALEQTALFKPDVITMDVNMPEMNGLDCLEALVALGSPARVVMVSPPTEAGAEVTLKALELGAIDFVPKPDGVAQHRAGARHAGRQGARGGCGAPGAGARPARPGSGLSGACWSGVRRPRATRRLRRAWVLIGVSRHPGGHSAGAAGRLPWPVVTAQQMPASFAGVFARRMDSVCALSVEEVSGPVLLAAGRVYIGHGDADVVIERRLDRLVAVSAPCDARPWHPCVNRMVETAMAVMGSTPMVGVLLTGMGDDGAVAITELRRRGGRTIAESEASSVVFGMPAELIRRGGADVVLHSEQVAAQLVGWSRTALRKLA